MASPMRLVLLMLCVSLHAEAQVDMPVSRPTQAAQADPPSSPPQPSLPGDDRTRPPTPMQKAPSAPTVVPSAGPQAPPAVPPSTGEELKGAKRPEAIQGMSTPGGCCSSRSILGASTSQLPFTCTAQACAVPSLLIAAAVGRLGEASRMKRPLVFGPAVRMLARAL